jgi:hypothetical protein
VDAPDADVPDVNILLDPALLATDANVFGIGREELNLPPAELDGVRKIALVERIGEEDRLHHLGPSNGRSRCFATRRIAAVGPSSGCRIHRIAIGSLTRQTNRRVKKKAPRRGGLLPARGNGHNNWRGSERLRVHGNGYLDRYPLRYVDLGFRVATIRMI